MNELRSSNLRGLSNEKSRKRTILAAVFILMILCPMFSCYAEDKKASEIMEEASANIEKYRKGGGRISFKTNITIFTHRRSA